MTKRKRGEGSANSAAATDAVPAAAAAQGNNPNPYENAKRGIAPSDLRDTTIIYTYLNSKAKPADKLELLERHFNYLGAEDFEGSREVVLEIWQRIGQNKYAYEGIVARVSRRHEVAAEIGLNATQLYGIENALLNARVNFNAPDFQNLGKEIISRIEEVVFQLLLNAAQNQKALQDRESNAAAAAAASDVEEEGTHEELLADIQRTFAEVQAREGAVANVAARAGLTVIDFIRVERAVNNFVQNPVAQKRAGEVMNLLPPGQEGTFPDELREVIYKFLAPNIDRSISPKGREIVAEVCVGILSQGLQTYVQEIGQKHKERLEKEAAEEKPVRAAAAAAAGAGAEATVLTPAPAAAAAAAAVSEEIDPIHALILNASAEISEDKEEHKRLRKKQKIDHDSGGAAAAAPASVVRVRAAAAAAQSQDQQHGPK